MSQDEWEDSAEAICRSLVRSGPPTDKETDFCSFCGNAPSGSLPKRHTTECLYRRAARLYPEELVR
jgi:hypothetical protein